MNGFNVGVWMVCHRSHAVMSCTVLCAILGCTAGTCGATVGRGGFQGRHLDCMPRRECEAVAASWCAAFAKEHCSPGGCNCSCSGVQEQARGCVKAITRGHCESFSEYMLGTLVSVLNSFKPSCALCYVRAVHRSILKQTGPVAAIEPTNPSSTVK